MLRHDACQLQVGRRRREEMYDIWPCLGHHAFYIGIATGNCVPSGNLASPTLVEIAHGDDLDTRDDPQCRDMVRADPSTADQGDA
jgi:hypothetical protein